MTAQLSAELLKLRTTRVPWVLGAVVGLLAGIAAAGVVGADALEDDPALGLVQAASFSTTLATIAGILLLTNEYRHGTIASTFLTEPLRLRVLAAKLVAGLIVGVVYALIAIVVTAAVALPWLSIKDEALPLDGQALEAAGRLVVSFALSGALGVAVGAIFRNQVGAIVAVFVWFLVVEPLVGVLVGLLEGDVGNSSIGLYLPGAAFDGIVGGVGDSSSSIRGGAAIALSAAYVTALAAVGGAAMLRRDPSSS